MSGPCQDISTAKALLEKKLVRQAFGGLPQWLGRICRRMVVGVLPRYTRWSSLILLRVKNAYIAKESL
jgi:hypothetical protein